MPVVEVTLVASRSAARLRSMISAVTTAIVESIDVPRESVRVIVRELPPTHFAAGDVTIAERTVETSTLTMGDHDD